jgi:hypothetical protein
MRAVIMLTLTAIALAAAMAQGQGTRQEFTLNLPGALPKAGGEPAPLSLTLRTDDRGLFPVVWVAGGGFASHRGYGVDGRYDGTTLTAHMRIFVVEYHEWSSTTN